MNKLCVMMVIVLAFVLGACAADGEQSSGTVELLVTDGTQEKAYSVAELEKLPVSEASFLGETYRGVQLTVLLEEAGYEADMLEAVAAVATDGYSFQYGPDLFLLEDTLVAYSRVDGPLAGDEGTFRMVLPDQEGKPNVRQVVEIRVNP